MGSSVWHSALEVWCESSSTESEAEASLSSWMNPPGGEAAWWRRRHWGLYLSDHLMQIVFQHIEVVVWFGFLGGHSLVLPLCCWVAQWNGELQPWKDSRRNRHHHSRAGRGVPVWPVWTGLVKEQCRDQGSDLALETHAADMKTSCMLVMVDHTVTITCCWSHLEMAVRWSCSSPQCEGSETWSAQLPWTAEQRSPYRAERSEPPPAWHARPAYLGGNKTTSLNTEDDNERKVTTVRADPDHMMEKRCFGSFKHQKQGKC